jgi:hypothetical protein
MTARIPAERKGKWKPDAVKPALALKDGPSRSPPKAVHKYNMGKIT